MLGFLDLGFDVILLGVICSFIFLDSRDAIFFSTISLLTFLAVSLLNLNNIIIPIASAEDIVNGTGFKMIRLFKGIFYIVFISTCLFYLLKYFFHATKLLEKKNDEVNISNKALVVENEKIRQLEQISRFQEYKFKTIFNSIQDFVLVFNYNFDLIEANLSFYEQSGYSFEEVNEIKFSNLIVPEQRDRLIRHFTLLAKGETVKTNAYIFIDKYNNRVDVEVNSCLMQYGEIPVVLSIASNFTQRKQDELALIESEEKFRNLFHYSKDAMLVLDLEQNILEVNNAFMLLMGFSKDDAIKTPFLLELFSEKHRAVIVERMKNYNTNPFLLMKQNFIRKVTDK
jgi:PAS domain S-box-containing protein